MKCFIVSIAVFCYFGTYLAADESIYSIFPYNDACDHEEVFNLLSSNIEHFVTLPTDATEAQAQKERLAIKLHSSLRSSTPMNQIPYIEGSFHNVLLRHQNELAGVATYFMKKDNSNCFIDSLFVNPPHNTSAAYLLLIKTVLWYAYNKQANYVETYESAKRKSLAEIEYQELIKMGFTEFVQMDEQKKENSVLLQLHTSKAIPLFKLF